MVALIVPIDLHVYRGRDKSFPKKMSSDSIRKLLDEELIKDRVLPDPLEVIRHHGRQFKSCRLKRGMRSSGNVVDERDQVLIPTVNSLRADDRFVQSIGKVKVF